MGVLQNWQVMTQSIAGFCFLCCHLEGSANWIFKNEKFEHRNMVVIPVFSIWREKIPLLSAGTNETNAAKIKNENYAYGMKYIAIKSFKNPKNSFVSGLNLIEIFKKPKECKGDYNLQTLSVFFLNLPPDEYHVDQLSGRYWETKVSVGTNGATNSFREQIDRIVFCGPDSPIRFSIQSNEMVLLKPYVLDMNRV
ncbi:MAG: hypothetical protein JNM63_20105, partial [Spirochaetia bacterium]|nr:hypothetical protein [Spirochaetia bacterium]